MLGDINGPRLPGGADNSGKIANSSKDPAGYAGRGRVEQSGLTPTARLEGREIPREIVDNVQLSPQARSLKVLEARVHATPEVDQNRVESARRAIDSGQYEINPERIADRLLAMESQFLR